MGGGIKKMIKIILQILTMVSLAISKAKGPLFQDWIISIPERDTKTDSAMGITYT